MKKSERPNEESEVIILQNGRLIPKGIFTISIFQGEKELLSIIKLYQNHMLKQEVGLIDVTSSFEDITKSKFGIYETLSTTYKMEVLKRKSNGMLHAIHHSNKTFIVMFQEIGDKEEIYKKGVLAMENSLVIKD